MKKTFQERIDSWKEWFAMINDEVNIHVGKANFSLPSGGTLSVCYDNRKDELYLEMNEQPILNPSERLWDAAIELLDKMVKEK